MKAMPEVAVSSASACTSAALQPSYVLGALGRDEERIHEQAVRVQDRAGQLIHVARRVVLERSRACTYPRVSRGLSGTRQWLSNVCGRLAKESHYRVGAESARLQAWSERVAALDPATTLRRGFAIARDRAGRLVTSAARLSPGDQLVTQFHDGTVRSDVQSVERASDQ